MNDRVGRPKTSPQCLANQKGGLVSQKGEGLTEDIIKHVHH